MNFVLNPPTAERPTSHAHILAPDNLYSAYCGHSIHAPDADFQSLEGYLKVHKELPEIELRTCPECLCLSRKDRTNAQG
jgi:hypothetical protein